MIVVIGGRRFRKRGATLNLEPLVQALPFRQNVRPDNGNAYSLFDDAPPVNKLFAVQKAPFREGAASALRAMSSAVNESPLISK